MTIDELLQQGRALPSIPKVVQELIQGLSKDDVLTGEIARLLATTRRRRLFNAAMAVALVASLWPAWVDLARLVTGR